MGNFTLQSNHSIIHSFSHSINTHMPLSQINHMQISMWFLRQTMSLSFPPTYANREMLANSAQSKTAAKNNIMYNDGSS